MITLAALEQTVTSNETPIQINELLGMAQWGDPYANTLYVLTSPMFPAHALLVHVCPRVIILSRADIILSPLAF